MWYDIFFVLFFLTSVVSTGLVYFSLKRINEYENFIIQIQQLIEFATEKMKMVDANGHYEADDETGFFFKQLKELQELLNGIFEHKPEESNIVQKK